MFPRATTFFAAAFLVLAPVVSHAALASYTQDFETLVQLDPAALSSDGWFVWGNVFTSANAYIYGYGAVAPNQTNAFCDVAIGQGGIPQGNQQLVVYSDYNNLDHATTRLIESNVYHEQTVGAADVGTRWTFQFDAKLGSLVSPTTALAFIKTIDPFHSYNMTNFRTLNMTAIPATWNTYSITFPIDPGLVGQLLQFGFNNTAGAYAPSGVFYDNIIFFKEVAGVGDPAGPAVMDLRPAAPNPFTSSTRMDYSMPQPGAASLTVYDVTGRRVATLFEGVASAGPHSATWDGRATNGRLAPVGVYRAVLQTPAGRTTRSVVLSR